MLGVQGNCGLHFELAYHTGNKVNGSKVQTSQSGGVWKYFCKQILWSKDWRHDFRHIVTSWKLSLPPSLRRILFLVSTVPTTSEILQPTPQPTPSSFSPVGQKNRTPRPPLEKKPLPAGLASFNGPPKECLPLHALSPPPMAEHRGKERGKHRGVTFLSALSSHWLSARLTGLLFRSTSWFWITVSWGGGLSHSWPGIRWQWGHDWKLHFPLSHISKHAETRYCLNCKTFPL